MKQQPQTRVKARARVRRDRLVRSLQIAIAVVFLVAAGTLAFQSRGSERAADGSSPQTSVLGKTLSSSNPAAPAGSPAASPRASARRCINSFNPDCGKFFWKPKPGANAKMTASLGPSASSAKVGTVVTLVGDAVDPDAPIACHWLLWGDETTALIPSVMIRPRYGRWEPPAKKRGTLHLSFKHTYKKAGTYHVQLGVRSGSGCQDNYSPYGNETVTIVTVSVR